MWDKICWMRAMMGFHTPVQGLLQLGNLRAQASPSKGRQHLWILLPIHKGFEHRRPLFPRMSVATAASLRLADSKTFWNRLI